MTTRNATPLRTCVVTGAAGFIGSRLTRRLAAGGVDVHAVVHPETDLWRLADVAQRINVHRCRVEDVAGLQDLSGIDVIFHLAAAGTNQEDADIGRAVLTNVHGTLGVMELANRVGARVVAAGSMLEYGPGIGHREDAALNPVNEYAASKAAAWLLARSYAARHGIVLLWLRTSSVYGPAQTPSFVIPYFIVQAVGGRQIFLSNGASARDFVYVDDAIDAFMAAARVVGLTGEAFNICSGRLVTVKEVADAIDGSIGGTSRVTFGVYNDRAAGVDACSADPAKAKTLLGWEAATLLSDGLGKTVDWYREHEARWQEAFRDRGYRSLVSAAATSASRRRT